MDVDEEERRKRVREQESGEDQHEEIPVPTEMPEGPSQPASPLTLQDIFELMQKGMSRNETNFDRIDRRVSTMQNEIKETKDIAAKATTIANDTKTQLTALERRVAQLEKGGGAAGSGPTQASPSNQGRRDWEQLGGEEGDTIVVGGFREYAQKEERREEWAKIQQQVTEPLRTKIKELIVPNAPCSTILLKIQREGGPTETRRAMLDWVRDFKALQIKETTAGETNERTFWAGPSKPFAMRQRDAKLTHMFEGIKLMAGEETAEKIHIDRSHGRIFWDRTLLVQRGPATGNPITKPDALSKTIHDFSEERLEAKIAEAKSIRESGRRPP